MTAAMPLPGVPALRLSGPSDLVATVPYLLGFAPQRSLVAVALRPPGDGRSRDSVVATVRLDLDDEVLTVLGSYVPEVRRYGADQLILLAYPDPNATTELSTLLEGIIAVATKNQVGVLDALLVRPDPEGGWRWWSLLCRDSDCCPAEGCLVDSHAPAAVEAVGAGLVALPSREDVEAEIAADLVRVGVVERALLRLTRPGFGDRSDWHQSEVTWATGMLHRAKVPMSGRTAARLLVAISDKTVRDCLYGVGEPRAQIALWADLTRCAPGWYRAPAATMLAVSHLAEGGGVRATVAVAAALDADPNYELAGLLHTALMATFPPPLVTQTLMDAAQESRRRIGR